MFRNHVSSNVSRSGGFVNLIAVTVLAAVIGLGYLDAIARAAGVA